MNLLEQHFDTAFAAPDGITKLRELILTLAMQGKLVEQDPADQPASELLKEIEAEKQRLLKAGKIKTPKPLQPITSEELPYQLPRGWARVRLGEIGTWKSGSTPSRNNYNYYSGNIPWVKSGEVKQGRITQTEETITELALNECPLSLNPKGSVLVAMYGANIGEVGILEIEAATNQAICACKTYRALDERYLLNLISSLKPYFISQGAGAAQPNISREKIVATPISLPPLAEQHRIVARIDQLMAHCDALERLRKERDGKRLAIHAAAIQQLLSTQSSSAWDFIEQHFNELYSVKENVAELRKAILQLAVMGRLVPQDPEDPPTSDLLKEIDAEKQRLVKAGKIKAPKPLPPINPEDVPYELPQGWEWVRFGNIAFQITDGAHHTPTYMDQGIPFLSVKDMSSGSLDFSDTRYISPRQHQELIRRCHPKKGDLLLTKVGTTGIPILVDVDCEFSIFVSVALIKFPHDLIEGKFLSWSIKAPSVKKQSEEGTEGVGNKNLVLRKIANFLLALPPLPEQRRIVARIDQLMVLCDALEQKISDATDNQTELLHAVMAQV
jgi:type I restriction enzyme S subunit